MLMTFPTKESLLRNLNERDVSEVFLIIANYKSLVGWNLIPLRHLTILLGPNSAGKSTIYEAIMAIRELSDGYMDNLEPGYRSQKDGEVPCVGFSMPYILEGRAETASLRNLLTSSPDTVVGDYDRAIA